jgi:hypothetical protein
MNIAITAKTATGTKGVLTSRLHLRVARLALERNLPRGTVKWILMNQGPYTAQDAAIVLDVAEAFNPEDWN